MRPAQKCFCRYEDRATGLQNSFYQVQPDDLVSKAARAVSEALASGLQLEPEALKLLEDVSDRLDIIQLIQEVARRKKETGSTIISKKDVEDALPQGFEVRADVHKAEWLDLKPEFEVVKDPTSHINPIEGVNGFHELFKSRFRKLLKIAKQRPDSHQLRPIKELGKGKKVAGLLLEKKMGRNRVELTIDDGTGSFKFSVLDDKLKRVVAELLLDQLVILDVEPVKEESVIVKGIYQPDLPDRVVNTSKKRVYALLISDLHVGSKAFLLDAFRRLILWLNCRIGKEDEEIVHRLQYVVMAGDGVDGIGVYSGQESDLEVQDAYTQYKMLSELLDQVPKRIKIFIIPGNHDPVRQALPQPAIPKRFAEPLYSLENLMVLGNPVNLRLHGVNVLVYHGRSLDDVIASTPGLTVTRPALAMKLLLKARHLAPIYGARTAISPEPEDHLVIEEEPDIFHSGHIHVLDLDRYKGTLIVNSGSWQGQTQYQANMGVEPTPGIAPIVDLSTLEVVVRDFTKPIV
ncbi:MAG: DNA-directed DNA polymerase II small subunit [Nitrososphaerota archaeon]